MKYSILFIVFFFVYVFQIKAQNYYWIAFTDKNNTNYSLDNAGEYLSERAIERRERQNIAIDSLDLPVNSWYVDSVLSLDVEFVHASKWLNGITVKTDVDSLDKIIPDWYFVKEIQLTKPALTNKSSSNKFTVEREFDNGVIDTSLYGGSVHQVSMLEGQFLHQQNFKGQGIQIAVLDGGFLNVNSYSAFDSLWINNQILGTKDIVNPNSDIYTTHYHGMSVLSCMGGNIPGELIGTAPKASYWLIRSEDVFSEYMVEEDHWVNAAEFADSAGVDIINSSLGYYEFDDSTTNHTYADMDGNTTRVTRAANIAASRGILVFASAGNERDDSWQRIIAPSDGDLVVGVGAVDKELNPAYFTSAGPAFGGAIKPNVSAMGYHTTLQLSNGNIGMSNGTSFSSPVLAGMAACLWQRYPDKTAAEIKTALEKSAHMYLTPDSLVGYGVPNMRTASEILDPLSVQLYENNQKWQVYPNPVGKRIVIQYVGNTIQKEINIEMYSLAGQLIQQWIKPASPTIVLTQIPVFVTGMFLLRINDGQNSETFKLTKSNW
ncbi:S8 family serine peptidase [Prolixibacteraceae bacterium Z1-6]|uniref:S8 family serine peptidase n=1 Tax=Draconibacterium aestuarii TaxID=2998507 RepID=A0A9X3F640_9BACT|nr:S8 family serine peptidase [Prolixibacteraceae bacterium Z1-6]